MSVIIVYGSSPEIFTFAQTSLCDVFVYHCLTDFWVAYLYNGRTVPFTMLSQFISDTIWPVIISTVCTLKLRTNGCPIIPSRTTVHKLIMETFPHYSSLQRISPIAAVDVHEPTTSCVKISKAMKQPLSLGTSYAVKCSVKGTNDTLLNRDSHYSDSSRDSHVAAVSY